jgi:hypothetical protein
MRIWRFWWQTLLVSAQHNPPQFIALIMLALAAILSLVWTFEQQWPYLILGMGYALGAAALIWVRELISPYPQRRSRIVSVTIGIVLMLILFGLILFKLSQVNLL